MKSASEFTKILIHREAVDMRRGINGLCDLVMTSAMGNLREPHLFVFTGRRRDRIKVLYFDRSGFCLWQKRLDEAKFPWPRKWTEDVITVTPEQFDWLLQGYDVWNMKPFAEINFSCTA